MSLYEAAREWLAAREALRQDEANEDLAAELRAAEDKLEEATLWQQVGEFEKIGPIGRAILESLQGGAMVCGVELARRARVSDRTIYRHFKRLRDMGYPIRSSIGVGYMMRQGKE